MTELVSWSLKFAYIWEMLAACLLFALPLKKRGHPWLGFALGAAISLGISGLTQPIMQLDIGQAIGVYLVQLAAVVLPIWMCCEITVTDAIYGALCAYAMQHFSSSLYILLAIGVGRIPLGTDGWINLHSVLFYLIAYGAPYTAMYFVFARPLGESGKYDADLFRTGGLTILVVPIALLLSLMAKLAGGGGLNFLLCQVYAMLCSIFVLWVQTSQKKEIYWRTELAVQEQLWQSQKEQYQLSRDTIEIINQKCHDLKHQVEALRTVCSEQQREASLREIERAVMLYDAAIQTGNQALDTVLTEKSLACEHKRIQWTCMADGRTLTFLDPVDLYAIFGNALDNAIEGVQEISEPEKRIISVTVFTRDRLTILQIENYYEQELHFQDGLPLSTKGDDTAHGFGMKSIRRIVEKYNGSLSVHTEDHIFVLNVVFPLPEQT